MRKDWSYKALGDLCQIIGGGTPSKRNSAFYDGDIPWATVRDMRHETLSHTEFRISEEAIENSSTNIIPAGNVVIATRVGLGKVCVLAQDTAINQDLRGIIPNTNNLDVRFLFRWFQSVADVIESEGTGATVKGVKLPFIKSLLVPVPPVGEQKRIVAILDEAFAGIDAAIANTEKNLANARELFESYLNSLFVLNVESWPEKRLDSLCEKITVGHVGSMAKRYQDDGIPLLRSQNIRPFEIDLNKVVYIDSVFHAELKKSALKPGDLAIVRTGYPGTAAVIPECLSPVNCSDLVIVRPSSEVSSHYLAVVFNSPYGKSAVTGALVGAAQKHFNVTAAKAAQIPLPSRKEQDNVVSEAAAIRAECLDLEKKYSRKLSALNELKQSLLQKAFSGELTANFAEKEMDEAVA